MTSWFAYNAPTTATLATTTAAVLHATRVTTDKKIPLIDVCQKQVTMRAIKQSVIVAWSARLAKNWTTAHPVLVDTSSGLITIATPTVSLDFTQIRWIIPAQTALMSAIPATNQDVFLATALLIIGSWVEKNASRWTVISRTTFKSVRVALLAANHVKIWHTVQNVKQTTT